MHIPGMSIEYMHVRQGAVFIKSWVLRLFNLIFYYNKKIFRNLKTTTTIVGRAIEPRREDGGEISQTYGN